MPRKHSKARPPKPKRGQTQANRMTIDVRVVYPSSTSPMTSTIGQLWEWKDKS